LEKRGERENGEGEKGRPEGWDTLIFNFEQIKKEFKDSKDNKEERS
jgi:hypothetical protein